MDGLGTAVVAAVTVTTQGGGAAAGDGAQRLVLHAAQAVAAVVVRAMGADDVTEGQCRGQCRRRCFWRVAMLAHGLGRSTWQVEQLQRRGAAGQAPQDHGVVHSLA